MKHPNRQAGWQEVGSGNESVVGGGSSAVTVAGGNIVMSWMNKMRR